MFFFQSYAKLNLLLLLFGKRILLMKKSNTVNLLTILFLTVFPLIFDDHYFNITITKYYTFAILCLAIFFAALYYKITSVDLKKKITLSRTDFIMLLFLGSSTLSCLLSEWKYASFTGSSGKHIGLLFLLLCGMLYYGITRYMTITRPILYSFPAILILCSVMSLFQFCGYDVLDFYKDMAAGTSVMYIATFGHVDVLSAFLSVYLPVCMYLFCHTSAKNEQVLYGAGCFFGILGVFCANSDSAYLGLATALAVLLVFALSDRAALLSYSFLLWIYCCAAALFQLLPMLSADMRTPSELTAMMTAMPVMLSVLIFAVILFCLSRFFHAREMNPPGFLKYACMTVCILILLVLLFLFVYFSFFDTRTPLGNLEGYLRFNDHWGSDRGYVWSWLLQIFAVSPFLTILFGAGPDTTTLLLYKYFEPEMTSLGSYYASAHNEYLNYLVTIGLAGLVFYLLLVLFSVIRCFRRRQENAFFGAVGIAILAYSAMAFVNISQPITVPFLFLLIGFANIKSH